jgi:hypothetical protein
VVQSAHLCLHTSRSGWRQRYFLIEQDDTYGRDPYESLKISHGPHGLRRLVLTDSEPPRLFQITAGAACGLDKCYRWQNFDYNKNEIDTLSRESISFFVWTILQQPHIMFVQS